MKKQEDVSFIVFVSQGRYKIAERKPDIEAKNKIQAKRKAVKLYGKNAIVYEPYNPSK